MTTEQRIALIRQRSELILSRDKFTDYEPGDIADSICDDLPWLVSELERTREALSYAERIIKAQCEDDEVDSAMREIDDILDKK